MAACSASATTPATPRRWQTHGIAGIDLLVVNLYPFEETVAAGADDAHRGREHRHRRPGDDPRRRQEPRLCRRRRRSRRLRRRARRALTRMTARRPTRSAGASRPRPSPAPPPTTRRSRPGSPATIGETLPAWRSFAGRLGETLRYGENPHQAAALYLTGEPRPGVATARQVQGKELSYNNINDTDAAYELVAEFDPARSRRRRHHQARQSLRRRRRRRRSPRPTARRSAAIRSPPSAASSRSTARSMPRPRPRSSRSSPR